MEQKKALVVYFSRAGENYNVGTVSKGSTEIVAEMIAKEIGADLFKIEPKIYLKFGSNILIDPSNNIRNFSAKFFWLWI